MMQLGNNDEQEGFLEIWADTSFSSNPEDFSREEIKYQKLDLSIAVEATHKLIVERTDLWSDPKAETETESEAEAESETIVNFKEWERMLIDTKRAKENTDAQRYQKKLKERREKRKAQQEAVVS